MSIKKFPPGWDEARVKKVLSHYENQSEEETVAEDEAAPEMPGQLFNSMVSVRQKKENNIPHLGLGLYIARMIAEFHGGHIKASNFQDGMGVCFSMVFKC